MKNPTNKLLIKRNVTPQKAIASLAKNGIQINEKEAKVILDFLYILAESTIRRYEKQLQEKKL